MTAIPDILLAKLALMVHISLFMTFRRVNSSMFFFLSSEGVADILYENRIRCNRYIFQGVYTLPCSLADIHCKTISGVSSPWTGGWISCLFAFKVPPGQHPTLDSLEL